MHKGIHFDETFTPTRQSEMSAILCCLCVLHNLSRKAWDVEKAYCCASIWPHQRIALRYRDGCKRYHPTTGEELFMLLLKNLYGDLAACKRWYEHTDEMILTAFNKGSWKAKRIRMDPALFFITHHATGEELKWMLVSVHLSRAASFLG